MLYSSLGTNRIRLAKFISGWGLELELQEVSLESCPPYTAISYTWGSRRDRTSIQVRCNSADCRFGSHRLSVPNNLGNALRRLHQLYNGTNMAFWADSICIDQSNRMERNRQVPLMRQVYTGAREVMVYLGEALRPEFANSCFISSPADNHPPSSLVGSYGDHCKLHSEQMPHHWGSKTHSLFDFIRMLATDPRRFFQVLQEERVRPDGMSYEKDMFEALRLMIHYCQWWNRVWVVQEVVLPAKVTVVYGPMAMSWTEFARAAQNIADSRPVFQQALPSEYTKVLDSMAYRILEVEEMRRVYRTSGGVCDLLQLLRQFGGRKATDQRDKIYALLGMAGAERSGVTPDYTLSESRVFQSAITDMITRMESLDPITGEFSTKHTTELPSWASDWSTTYEPVDRVRLENIQHYRASLNCPVRTLRECGDGTYNEATRADDATCLRDHGHGLISVLGRDVDTVVALGDPKFPDAHVFSVIASWAQLMSRFFGRRDGDRDIYYGTGDSLDKAFQRTICGDLFWDGTTAVLTSDEFRRIKAKDDDEIEAWLQAASSDFSWGAERDGACGVASGSVVGTYCHESRQQEDSMLSTDRVSTSVRVATSRRRFFITSSGLMGLGPVGTCVGDHVYVLFGGKTPFILRPVESGQRVGLHRDIKDTAAAYRADYKVIGDCYVHGTMDGENMPHDPTASIDFTFHQAIWEAENFTWWNAEQGESKQKHFALEKELEDASRDWPIFMRKWEAEINVEPKNTLMVEALELCLKLKHPNLSVNYIQHSIQRVEELVDQTKALNRKHRPAAGTITLKSDDSKQWLEGSKFEPILSDAEPQREKNILEARSRLQGIEVRLLSAEEQLRATKTTWDETIYRCLSLMNPMSNTEVQEAHRRRREVVSTWAMLTGERQQVVEELQLLHAHLAELIATSEYQLKTIGMKWITELQGSENEEVEALKADWLKWFDKWMMNVKHWRSGTSATIKRQPDFHDLETDLYEAEGRLLRVMDEMILTEEWVRRASRKIEEKAQNQDLGVKEGMVQTRSRLSSVEYVYLV